jgi:hypothetical protein
MRDDSNPAFLRLSANSSQFVVHLDTTWQIIVACHKPLNPRLCLGTAGKEGLLIPRHSVFFAIALL